MLILWGRRENMKFCKWKLWTVHNFGLISSLWERHVICGKMFTVSNTETLANDRAWLEELWLVYFCIGFIALIIRYNLSDSKHRTGSGSLEPACERPLWAWAPLPTPHSMRPHQWLESATVAVCTPWKSASATNKDFFPGKLVIEHIPLDTGICSIN